MRCWARAWTRPTWGLGPVPLSGAASKTRRLPQLLSLTCSAGCGATRGSELAIHTPRHAVVRQDLSTFTCSGTPSIWRGWGRRKGQHRPASFLPELVAPQPQRSRRLRAGRGPAGDSGPLNPEPLNPEPYAAQAPARRQGTCWGTTRCWGWTRAARMTRPTPPSRPRSGGLPCGNIQTTMRWAIVGFRIGGWGLGVCALFAAWPSLTWRHAGGAGVEALPVCSSLMRPCLWLALCTGTQPHGRGLRQDSCASSSCALDRPAVRPSVYHDLCMWDRCHCT